MNRYTVSDPNMVMNGLPLELKIKVLSFLTNDNPTLRALFEVFPRDAIVEQLFYACPIVLIGSQNLGNLGFRKASFNTYRDTDILMREKMLFRFPVESLNLFIIHDSTASNSQQLKQIELNLSNVHELFIKEPNLVKIKKLQIHYLKSSSSVLIDHKKIFEVIPHLPSLQNLKLSDGFIPTSSKKFPRLESVTMDYCELEDMPRLVNLKQMSLRGNHIKYLLMNDLNKFHHLKKIDLSYNRITSLDNIELPRLEELNLQCNNITTIDKDFGELLPNLRTLDLSNNPVRELPNLSGTKLKILNLDNTLIDKFDNISVLTGLKNLIIGGDFDEISGISLLTNLEYLELKNSKLYCKKGITKLQGLPQSLKTLKIVCHSIERIENLPIKLQALKLFYTKVKRIENLNSDLLQLEVVGTSVIEEVDADVTDLIQIHINNVGFDSSEFRSRDEMHIMFRKYCMENGIKYNI